MKKTLIIVTDLGCLRSYERHTAEPGQSARLELLEEFVPDNAHARISDLVTDQQGRFPRGAGPMNISGDMSAGERNDLELEEKKRVMKQIVGRLEANLSDSSVGQCYFAAGSEINRQLVDALTPAAAEKITKNLSANIVKADKQELLTRF